MSDEEILTAYVTKYATTVGVMRVRGRIKVDSDKPYLIYRPLGAQFDSIVSWSNWFRGEDQALVDARKKVSKKLASLRKSADDMEGRLMRMPIKDLTGGHE
ncbi:hypothetical protein ACNPMX_11730 [Stenotrophomonas maltophilia]